MAYSKRNHLYSESKIIETLANGETFIPCESKQQRSQRIYKLNGQLALMSEVNPDIFKEQGFIEIMHYGDMDIRILRVKD